MSGNYTPVIIIGAPRSGTNMLRDVLSSFGPIGTWDCDEINAIWRYGNVRVPSDAFSRIHARTEVRQYIQKQFRNLAEKKSVSYVLEKTCANSLRVDFVDAIFPNAKYLYIVRDGRDVLSSAMKRWRSGVELSYLLKKVRYVPVGDLPYYVSNFAKNRVSQWFSDDSRLKYWGPKFEGMDELLLTSTLDVVCAKQWAECVTSADDSFSKFSEGKYIYIKYEDIVKAPIEEIERILEFIGIDMPRDEIKRATRSISPKSVGKGRSELGTLSNEVRDILYPLLVRHDYE